MFTTMGLFSFLLDEVDEIFTVPLTLILSIQVFRFSMGLPHVNYLTNFDIFLWGSLITLCLTFIENIVWVFKKDKQIRTIMAIIISAMWGLFVITFVWIRYSLKQKFRKNILGKDYIIVGDLQVKVPKRTKNELVKDNSAYGSMPSAYSLFNMEMDDPSSPTEAHSWLSRSFSKIPSILNLVSVSTDEAKDDLLDSTPGNHDDKSASTPGNKDNKTAPTTKSS